MRLLQVASIDALILFLSGPSKPHRDGPQDLSEEQHYSEGEGHEHNVQYDHEAFLGKEESDKFDHLSRKEARRRLG